MKLRTLQDTIKEFRWFINEARSREPNHEMLLLLGAFDEKIETFRKAIELELTYYETEKPRMTKAQRDTLWELCGRYNVPFNESDYYPRLFMGGLMYEGWVGGYCHGDVSSSSNDGKPENRRTIYVAVEPNGDSHS